MINVEKFKNSKAAYVFTITYYKKGESIISNIDMISRCYENIQERFDLLISILNISKDVDFMNFSIENYELETSKPSIEILSVNKNKYGLTNVKTEKEYIIK